MTSLKYLKLCTVCFYGADKNPIGEIGSLARSNINVNKFEDLIL